MKHFPLISFSFAAFTATTTCIADPLLGIRLQDYYDRPSCCDGILRGVDLEDSEICIFGVELFEAGSFEDSFCLCDTGSFVPASACLECCIDIYIDSCGGDPDCDAFLGQLLGCENGCLRSCRDACDAAFDACFFGCNSSDCFDDCVDDSLACENACNEQRGDRMEQMFGYDSPYSITSTSTQPPQF